MIRMLTRRFRGDSLFRIITALCAFLIVAVTAGFFIQLLISALPAFEQFGAGFLFSSQWDPGQSLFGALPSVTGTLLTTGIAIVIAVPISFFIAFLLAEKLPPMIAKPVGYAVDLLAAVPSIIYGMWGFLVLLPLMQLYVQPILQSELMIPFGEKPSIVRGGEGKTVVLDGAAGWLEVEHSPYLDFGSDFTMAIRIKSQKSEHPQTLISKGESLNLSLLADGRLEFNGAVSDSPLNLDGWLTLAAIQKNGKPQLYAQGQILPIHTDSWHSVSATEAPLWFGRANAGNFLKGEIDWLRTYSQSLLPNEIRKNAYGDVSEVEKEMEAYRLECAWQFEGFRDGAIFDMGSGLKALPRVNGIDLNIFRTSLFSGLPTGNGVLSAGLILALMILPFISAVMRDIFQMTPAVIKESAYGMGATGWETTLHVTLRYGMQGFLGAVFLGLGRALGETMAVLFIIGNAPYAGSSLFAPASTIASTLANSFAEADGIFRNVLFALGLILLVMSFGIQVMAQWWLNSVRKTQGTGL